MLSIDIRIQSFFFTGSDEFDQPFQIAAFPDDICFIFEIPFHFRTTKFLPNLHDTEITLIIVDSILRKRCHCILLDCRHKKERAVFLLPKLSGVNRIVFRSCMIDQSTIHPSRSIRIIPFHRERHERIISNDHSKVLEFRKMLQSCQEVLFDLLGFLEIGQRHSSQESIQLVIIELSKLIERNVLVVGNGRQKECRKHITLLLPTCL